MTEEGSPTVYRPSLIDPSACSRQAEAKVAAGPIGTVAFHLATGLALAALALVSGHIPAQAQNGWSTGVLVAPQPAPATRDDTAPAATTVLPRSPAPAAVESDPASAVLTLEATLTNDSEPISRGLVWRIFALGGPNQPAKLVKTRRDARPTLKLAPGRYAINAAFGRAHLTQILMLPQGSQNAERFVLNAGGLRVQMQVPVADPSVTQKARYDIYSDERDQSGARKRIVTNAKPGLITRLNSGIYHIVSRLGDANALVSAEVAVEAGKLTEAVVSHEAAKVTFKLVRQRGGEAVADTQWIILTRSGDIIKETAGALPSHVLAPGSYSVSARRDGTLFTSTFKVKSGDNAEVEVLMR